MLGSSRRPGRLHAAVVNYRTPGDLSGFLESWRDHAPPWAYLTIVNVDPTPDDEKVAADWMTRMGRTNLAYQSHSTNVGYSHACNAAVSGTDHEVYALFNADTRLLPKEATIEILYHDLMDNEDWGVVGPRQVDDKNRITHGGIMGTNSKVVQRGWLHPDKGQFSEVEEAVSVMGSAYFVKRKCWDELWHCPEYRKVHPGAVGAFLPTGLFYEETFCSYHARSHGWRVVYHGATKMVHRYHQSINQLGNKAGLIFRQSEQMFRETCEAHGIEHNVGRVK